MRLTASSESVESANSSMCSPADRVALYPPDAMRPRTSRDRDVPGRRRPSTGGRQGQVAVEWLMVAGILTAVAIIIVGLIQPVLVEIVRYLARSVRMVGV